MFKSFFAQRCLGGFFAIAGVGATLWLWHDVRQRGFRFPVDYARLKSEWGADKIETYRQMPAVWWILSAIGLLCAGANVVLLSRL